MLKQIVNNKPVRLIAFYLPQFHPIPENDGWWDKGFTEWTNVKKGKPLFLGHYQPRIPGELGYYNILDAEIREKQAQLAREHGIEGFCYWHYWFGNGVRLLEKPFNQVLHSGKPEFPFCLAWANQSWSGAWHGIPDKILMKQTYPGIEDYKSHFNNLLPAFKDGRYIKVDGKPLFIIFQPQDIPEQKVFIDCWRELAVKSGLKGIYFVALTRELSEAIKVGYDAYTIHQPSCFMKRAHYFAEKIYEKVTRNWHVRNKIFKSLSLPTIYSYKRIVKTSLNTDFFETYPCIVPNWDNTPRCGIDGIVFHGSRPKLFRNMLQQAINRVSGRDPEHKIIFIRSWNEWAEGNYLEPDMRFGKRYLEVIREEISKFS